MTMAAAPFHSAAEATLPEVAKHLTRKGTGFCCSSQRDCDTYNLYISPGEGLEKCELIRCYA